MVKRKGKKGFIVHDQTILWQRPRVEEATLSRYMLAQGPGLVKVKCPVQKTEVDASSTPAKPVWLASESNDSLPPPVPKVVRKARSPIAKPKPLVRVQPSEKDEPSTNAPTNVGKAKFETTSNNDDDEDDDPLTVSSGVKTSTEHTYAQIAINPEGEEVINLKPPRRKAASYSNFDDAFEDERGTRQLRDFHGGLILPSKDFRRRGQAERKQMRAKGY